MYETGTYCFAYWKCLLSNELENLKLYPTKGVHTPVNERCNKQIEHTEKYVWPMISLQRHITFLGVPVSVFTCNTVGVFIRNSTFN